MSIDLNILRRWIGREQEFLDIIADQPVYALGATINREDAIPQIGDAIMLGGHWLFFQEILRAQDLDVDGHPKRGGFLPPVPLPRRLWAGGRLRFIRDLKIGDQVTRKSTIQDVKYRDTRVGDMVIVTVRHEVADEHGTCVWEEQDLAYLPKPDRWAPPVETKPRPAMPIWARTQVVDPVMLFRYSALTFNSHRIHYDYKYATEEEGYPGLVVHGPLLATILMSFAEEHGDKPVKGFTFRSHAPLFDSEPFELEGLPDESGTSAQVWAVTPDGSLAIEAEVQFEGSEAVTPQETVQVEEAEATDGDPESDMIQHVDMSMAPTIDATWEIPDGEVTGDVPAIEAEEPSETLEDAEERP